MHFTVVNRLLPSNGLGSHNKTFQVYDIALPLVSMGSIKAAAMANMATMPYVAVAKWTEVRVMT